MTAMNRVSPSSFGWTTMSVSSWANKPISIVLVVGGAVFGDLSEESVQLAITTTAPLVAVMIGYYFGKVVNE